ncbi:YDG domain-containing protein [Paucibacter sp. R3-3]|uniref:YDG domain-containing protein n=1 Tax=Roseateles agri TaxID=3098619 RepID=A0ABU5DII1_9BURK|nr:YDG domain-containing protein [Paucibacter sp. R3-3]MDY0745959.1 YDG domain-containing protein [Paucibacter sp. R3-3]
MSTSRTSVLLPTLLPTRFARRRLALALAACCCVGLAQAGGTLPTGMQVAQGQASAVVNGNKLTITNSNGAILNWQSFSIGAQNAVRFDQASAASKVLNRVTGSDPSSILGSLSSNGQVWLLNPNGVLFGQGARVDVAGLVTSTLNLNDQDWSAGRYLFTTPVSGSNGVVAGITNQGEIRSAAGGQVMLIAAGEVRNEGLIDAAGGQIVLAAGASVELVDTASPRFSVKVSAPQGEVLNLGQVSAAGGRIDVIAASVNQQGLVRADSLSVGPGGEIVMNAGQRLTLAAGSKTTADGSGGTGGTGGTIELLGTQVALLDGSQVSASGTTGGGTVLVGGGAQGKDASVPNSDAVYFAPGAGIRADATGSGDGGHIVLWSNSATRAYGSLSATGGAQGGDGGFIETSGGWLDARPAAVNLSAPNGKAGIWLLDPYDITISDNVSDSGTDPNFTATTEGSTIYSGTLQTALGNGSAVVVQTGSGGSAGNNVGNIAITNATINVTSLTPGSLTLIADADITMTDSSIVSQNPMPVSVQAGRGLGTGRIQMNDSRIVSGGGDITLGGFGSGGTASDYSSFGNTAFAASSGGPGIWLRNDSILDGGTTGNVSLSGVGDTGVLLNLATVRGKEITIHGTGNAGAGVEVDSTGLTGTGTMLVDGFSAAGGAGVSISAGTIRVAPADYNEYRTLTINGTSGGLLSGIEVLSANTLIQAGYATDLYLNARNSYDSQGSATLALKGTLDSMQGYGITINASSTSSSTAAVSMTNAVLNASGTVNISGPGSLALNNSKVNAGGQINVQADNVSLGIGSQLASTDSYDTDVIVITGNNGQPLSSFFNNAGADALHISDTSNGGRWIVWANDVTDGQTFSPGGLNYDFTLHGAQYNGAWQGYLGNGYISFQNKNGNAYGGSVVKDYDGTTSASPSYIVISAPAVGGSASGQLTDSSAVHFDDKNVGSTGISVDAGGVSFVDSAGKPVYGINTIDSILTGQINPKAITVSVAVDTKTYDTTTAATAHVTFNGLVDGESLQGSAGAANFVDAHAGTGKSVSVNMSYSDGADGTGLLSNYTITGPTSVTGDILKAQLSISGLTAQNKVYDTTTAATIGGTATVTPFAGDSVSVGGTASGSFADKNVGTGKQVTVTGLTLTGTGASDYELVSQPTGLTANITPASLPVSGLVAQNKIYDGTTAATLQNTGVVQALGNDQVTVSGGTGQFADKNVGTGKTVIVTGVTLSGPDAGNYSATSAQNNLTADITPLSLNVYGVFANNKVYDATTAATLGGTALVYGLGGDAVSVSGTGVASFQDKNVGAFKPLNVSGFSLSGADAGNYTLVQPVLTATISQATLTYVATAATTQAGLIPTLQGTVTGFVGSETQADSTTGTLSFVTPANTNSPDGQYAINGQGLSAQNYRFVQAEGNATALTITGGSQPVVVPPVDQSVKTTLLTIAAIPSAPTNASTGSVLDLTGPANTTGAVIASASALAAAPAGAASFAPVRISGMSMDELAAMLEARDRYKKKLFADAIFKLEQNPALADVRACTSLGDAASGACLVTVDLKRQQAALTAKAEASVQEPQKPSLQEQAFLATRRHVKQASLPQIERKVAVIIGVDKYEDKEIPQLDNAVSDAEAVGKLFESKLGYETVVIPNATKATVIGTLNRLALTMSPKDSVVIYYAGHGDVVEATSQGYWLLSDADAKKPETWLSNADIGRLVTQIGASQVALISDSCYSGSLVSADQRIRGSSTGSIDPTELLERKSVVVMSSGGNEPVFDSGKQGHSPFSYNLMNQLNQVDKWQPGGNVFERVRFAVAKELPQRPQYGAAVGHQAGGDYLFEQRQLDAAGANASGTNNNTPQQ